MATSPVNLTSGGGLTSGGAAVTSPTVQSGENPVSGPPMVGQSTVTAASTSPVSMQTASVSQPVDSTSSQPDGGAAILQAILGSGQAVGTQVIAGNQAQATQKNQLALAQVQAQTQVSSTTMLTVVVVAAVILVLMLRGK